MEVQPFRAQMQHYEQEIDICAPASVVYNQWMQFGEYPEIITGMTESGQLDFRRLYWSAMVLGKEMQWEIEIVENDPGSFVSWHSTSGPRIEGSVHFQAEGDDTRLHFALAYVAESLSDNLVEAQKFVEARVNQSLRDFRDFIERRGRETGGWSVRRSHLPLV